MNDLDFIRRLDAALARRVGAPREEFHNVACEVCGTNIKRYFGPNPGVICRSCYEPSGEGYCTRIMPLAITRSSIRE